MKKTLLILCTLFAYINNAKAQVVISTSDLNGTKWQIARDYINQKNEYYEYTLGEVKWHKSDGNTYAFPYYLSDTIVSKFEYSKVGKNTKGRYYVEINPKYDITVCFSIISFDKTKGEMVMRKEYIASGTPTNTFYLMPIDTKKHPRDKDPDAVDISDLW